MLIVLIEHVFVALWNFPSSLSTECVSLNDEPLMIRHTLISLNTVEIEYYPFMNRLDKLSGSLQKYIFQKNKIHKC